MKKNINLSVPFPCREKWENITSTAGGGFCNSCKKMVIDFSKMADAEVLDFLNQKPHHACGRFRSDQLRSYAYVVTPAINPGFTLLKAGVLSMLLLMIGKPAPGQNLTEKANTEVTHHQNITKKALSVSDTLFRVKGVVVDDENHSAMAGVNVILQGSSDGVATDVDGRFDFPRKLRPGDILLFSSVGLETQAFTIPERLNGPLEIRLKMEFIVLGELQVNEGTTEKPSGLHKLWTKVKGLF
jgi:hypothetical protein